MLAAMPPTSASSLAMAAAQAQSQTEWDGYVAGKVEQFLEETAPRPLLVCMGSASVAGLVWLAERTDGRRVTLVIGDLKTRNWKKASDESRDSALQFVTRCDVDIRSWYRTARNREGAATAHLKVWAAASPDSVDAAEGEEQWTEFLVGSANLTRAGLNDNIEVIVRPDPSEHNYLHGLVKRLRRKAWDADDRIRELLHGNRPRTPNKPPRRPISDRQRTTQPQVAAKPDKTGQTASGTGPRGWPGVVFRLARRAANRHPRR